MITKLEITRAMRCRGMRLNPTRTAKKRGRRRHSAVRSGSPKEPLHKSKPVIASAAKQSISACESCTYGSPRRCAPHDDGLLQTFPREPLHKSKPVIASAAKQSISACQSTTYGSPRRCAPRDDGLMQTLPKSAMEVCLVASKQGYFSHCGSGSCPNTWRRPWLQLERKSLK